MQYVRFGNTGMKVRVLDGLENKSNSYTLGISILFRLYDIWIIQVASLG